MSRGDHTYPATCGRCVGPLDADAIARAIRRKERVECPHCGRVLHVGGTFEAAVEVLTEARRRGVA
jgi:DNA-directed RNA polymerase subunit RPC12/RpoP